LHGLLVRWGTYNHSMQSADLIEQVERDGFVVIPGLLDPATVRNVGDELAAMLDEDEAIGQESAGGSWGRGGVLYETETGGTYYRSVFEPEQHTLFFPSAYSEGLQALIQQIISDPDIRAFTDRVLGKNYRLRIDYVRRMTGTNDWVDDFELPHEWHRDSPGAFTFGIFFDDTPTQCGATAAVRGTHWQPYDPRYDMILSERSYLSRERHPARVGPQMHRWAFTSHKLRDHCRANAAELTGQPGDVYFFLNDVWHGRAPNVKGSRNILLRFNGFPSDFQAPENLPLHKLCSSYQDELGRRYSRDQGPNIDPDTLQQRLQRRLPRKDLFTRAANEKQRLLRIGEWLGWHSARVRPISRRARIGSNVVVWWAGIKNAAAGDYVALYDAAGTAATYAYLKSKTGRARRWGLLKLAIPEIAAGPCELRLYSAGGTLLGTSRMNVLEKC
jgi:hypothetical protein